MIIREMSEAEIATIGNFPPEEWNMDIVSKFKSLYGKCNFYPFVAEKDGVAMGICSALINGSVGWLGHVLVLPEYRKRGIGKAMTEFLIQFFDDQGCESQLLIATEMGEPVYRKCGFEVVSRYRVYHSETIPGFPEEKIPVRSTESDLEDIFELDREISQEDRSHLLKAFCDEAWIRRDENGDLLGFFIPGYENGFVMARDEQVGLELMLYKLTVGRNFVMVPLENKAAVAFLESKGFERGYECNRMELGKPVNWNPSGIFSRTGGDCG